MEEPFPETAATDNRAVTTRRFKSQTGLWGLPEQRKQEITDKIGSSTILA